MDTYFLASGFQEDVIYTPSGGAAKTIKAVVLRGNAVETQQRAGGSTPLANRVYDLQILISTDATTGIAQVTPREDKVSVAQRLGEAAKVFLVQGVVVSDEGAWRLGLG
jgi:hypothetical protein